jgi:hypothetical protein
MGAGEAPRGDGQPRDGAHGYRLRRPPSHGPSTWRRPAGMRRTPRHEPRPLPSGRVHQALAVARWTRGRGCLDRPPDPHASRAAPLVRLMHALDDRVRGAVPRAAGAPGGTDLPQARLRPRRSGSVLEPVSVPPWCRPSLRPRLERGAAPPSRKFHRVCNSPGAVWGRTHPRSAGASLWTARPRPCPGFMVCGDQPAAREGSARSAPTGGVPRPTGIQGQRGTPPNSVSLLDRLDPAAVQFCFAGGSGGRRAATSCSPKAPGLRRRRASTTPGLPGRRRAKPPVWRTRRRTDTASDVRVASPR